jgi:uncharacterized protein YcsI (UPF0317 family)
MSKVHLSPADLRLAARGGAFSGPTSGHVPGFLQANLMVVAREDAADFMLFCQRNPKPCPLIEVTRPGAREALCAPGSDLATDLPGYRLYIGGELDSEHGSAAHWWRDDLVSFLIGCSFSFEAAVEAAGFPLRHMRQGLNVAMYRTNIPCQPAGRFSGELVVSMRPIRSADIAAVAEISSRFPDSHGGPVHVGDPAAIGIADLSRPDYGDPVLLQAGERPVFWACGVTAQSVAQKSRLPFCITHAPGKMFATDRVC